MVSAHLPFPGFSREKALSQLQPPKEDLLPWAVFLTSGLGSFAGVLQRQCVQVPEQIGRVSFQKFVFKSLKKKYIYLLLRLDIQQI